MQRRNLKAVGVVIVSAATVFAVAAGSTASRAQNASRDSTSPTFGSRTENPDGSVALRIGRRLPTEWETKFGVDASLAPQSPADGAAMYGADGSRSSSSALWGSVTGPSVAPLIFDKTAIDARVDSREAHGQVGATLSRTVPVGGNFSVILRDQYSVTQSLHDGAPSSTALQPQAADSTPSSVWNIDRSVSLRLGSTGTTLSAGMATSSDDTQWHNRLSAEQQIIGPLSVTTSVSDPGSAASNKSISAEFKHTW
jgi:hypothetical protein